MCDQGSPDGEPFVPLDDMDSNNQPVLTISLGGRRELISAEEVRSLTLQQFAALWTVCCSPVVTDSKANPYMHLHFVASRLCWSVFSNESSLTLIQAFCLQSQSFMNETDAHHLHKMPPCISADRLRYVHRLLTVWAVTHT